MYSFSFMYFQYFFFIETRPFFQCWSLIGSINYVKQWINKEFGESGTASMREKENPKEQSVSRIHWIRIKIKIHFAITLLCTISQIKQRDFATQNLSFWTAILYFCSKDKTTFCIKECDMFTQPSTIALIFFKWENSQCQ